MTRRSRILLAGLAWLSVTAPVAPQPSPKSNIDEFFDRYVKDRSRQSPYTSTWTQVLPPKEQEKLDTELDPETEASTTDYFRYTREALSELRKFERSRMTPVQRVTARALEWDLDNILRSEPFRDYGYVFEQHFGIQLGVVQFLSSTHPIRNEQDARNYLARLRQVAVRFDEGIVVAREREKKKIVPPREILSATIEQIKRFIAPEPAANLLVTSLDERLAKVSGVPAAARADFVHTAEGIVKESVYPAYRRVMALLESQIPGSTDDAGWWRFPNGDKAYAQKLRSSTTTSLTADEIHQLGLREVARIEKEIDRVLRQLGYTAGTLEERLAAAQRKLPVIEGPDAAPKALARYEEIVRDAYKRSEALFDIVPKAKVEIVRIPEFREATNATAYYTGPAPDGSRPGTFWVPVGGTSVLVSRTRAYHEAVPGHHFQIAIQMENTEMPKIRSLGFVGSSAFSEGWGLYVERLAWEEGWYKGDLEGELIYLTESDLFRARRLVVDTGIHAKKWTINQGVEYGIRRGEVQRYAVRPGQATSYKIGQQRILAIREKARLALGSRFSLREFHDVVLRTGNVPFDVLEGVVDDYIREAKAK